MGNCAPHPLASGKYGGNNVLREVRVSRLAKLEIFDERIRDFSAVVVGDARGDALHFLHQSIEVVARVRDADDSDRGAVPKFGGVEFRDRNVEARAQPIFQAANHLTAIFDGLCCFDVEFECEKGDGHAVSSFRLPVRESAGITNSREY